MLKASEILNSQNLTNFLKKLQEFHTWFKYVAKNI